MNRITLFCTLSLVLMFNFAFSQTVKGKVIDQSNLPLPGVNVLVEGANIGTVTDFDGKFEIKGAKPDAILNFSYIGFKTAKVALQGKTFIDVVLTAESETLNEIVIVGTSVKKGDLTGAIVNVSQKTLEQRPVTSINDALQGRAAGVFIQNDPSPGGNSSIKIRGNNSLQYGGNPIFVVDGIVMDGDFNLTNLNDVASVSILKDASSTALYGSRGANGVVVVTTKKGSKGEGTISYKTWMGMKDFTNENLTLGAKDMYNLRIDALSNSHVATDYFSQYPNAPKEQFVNEALLGPNSTWFADYEKESYAQGKNYNWLKQVTRTAVEQNHSLSFSGGSEKGTYYMSVGYVDDQGLMKNSGNTRYSGRINAESKIKRWLKVGTNTAYTKSISKEVDGAAFEDARAANPLLPIERYKDTLYLAWGNNWDINAENPLNTLKIQKDRSRSKITSSNYAEINPIKGLTARTTFAIDFTNQEYYEYIPSDIQQSARNTYHGAARHNLDYDNYYQWDNSIAYDTNFGKSSLKALVSTSLSKTDFHYTNVLGVNFPTDDLGYYNLGSATDKSRFELGSDFSASTLMSYLGRVNYDFAGRYNLTLTGRFDGSSKFAEGNQWGFFPSVAASWDIAKEGFMKDQKLFNQMKLRFGYGNVGNQNIPDYAFYSLYKPGYTGGNGTYNSTGLRGTPNLTWEKQNQSNVGLDLQLFNNRLTITADYFNIVNSNLLMRRTLSPLTGYKEAIENIGEMTNKGFELSVAGDIIKNDSFNWNLSANISTDKNKITKLYGDLNAIYNFGGFTGTDIQRTGNFFLGQSLNSIYMWEFDRIIQEKDMDYVNGLVLPGKTLQPGDILPKDQQKPGEKGYGVIDENDRVIVGKQDPKFYGGFSSEFSYKNFSLNAVFTYSYGATKISGYYESLMNSNGFGPAHTDMLNRWTPTNTDTNIPRVTYDNAQRFGAGDTSWGLQDASYLRLSTVTVSFTMPKAVLDKTGLANLRLYVSGNNLFTWTKYKGYDPENGDWYPTAKMIVTGLDISF